MRPYRQVKRLIVPKQQIDRRARGYRKQNRHSILFSDETIVYCVPHTNLKNDVVWALQGDIIPPALHDRHSAKLIVCAAVWENGRSEIYIFKGNLPSPLYIDILQNVIIKEGKKSLVATGSCSSMVIPVIRPPPKSPDFDIIENIWYMLIQEM